MLKTLNPGAARGDDLPRPLKASPLGKFTVKANLHRAEAYAPDAGRTVDAEALSTTPGARTGCGSYGRLHCRNAAQLQGQITN
jgi:hypothetical protein